MFKMRLQTFLCLFLAGCHTATGETSDATTKVGNLTAEGYLASFGYLDLSRNTKNETQADNEFHLAVALFQKNVGIDVTGQLDAKTKEAMMAPRCGVKDTDTFARASQYKWTSNDLTWKIEDKTSQFTDGEQRRALAEAFKVWEAVTPLRFREAHTAAPADITVQFNRLNHGDGYDFDGYGVVLAHAFYPKDGRLHFDDDESWVFLDDVKSRRHDYKDLLKVGVHEIGHVLGLDHSKVSGAIMGAIYQRFTDTDPLVVTLGGDDVQKVQQLYGSPTNPITTTTTQAPTTRIVNGRVITPSVRVEIVPDQPSVFPGPGSKVPFPKPLPPLHPPQPPSGQCPWGQIDAIETASNGEMYIFYDDHFVTFRNGQLSSPRLIAEAFPGGPRGIKHATVGRQGELFLMSDTHVWGYEMDGTTGNFLYLEEFDSDLPQELIGFRADAVMLWTDRNIVFLKGDQFTIYSYPRNQATFSGKIEDYFHGVPNNAHEGFLDGNGHLYFLLADGVHEYDPRSKSLAPPVELSDYFAC